MVRSCRAPIRQKLGVVLPWRGPWSPTSQAQARPPLRFQGLSPAQRDRAYLLPSQGLSPHRHALRQAGQFLPSRCRHCIYRQLLVM